VPYFVLERYNQYIHATEAIEYAGSLRISETVACEIWRLGRKFIDDSRVQADGVLWMTGQKAQE
jgi:hypothetical protein